MTLFFLMSSVVYGADVVGDGWFKNVRGQDCIKVQYKDVRQSQAIFCVGSPVELFMTSATDPQIVVAIKQLGNLPQRLIKKGDGNGALVGSGQIWKPIPWENIRAPR